MHNQTVLRNQFCLLLCICLSFLFPALVPVRTAKGVKLSRDFLMELRFMVPFFYPNHVKPAKTMNKQKSRPMYSHEKLLVRGTGFRIKYEAACQ